MAKFLIEARDSEHKRIGVIEQYTSLDVIVRHNAVGSWTLTVPSGSPEAALLTPGRGIIVWIDGLPKPVMSGPITGVKHEWSADQPGMGQVTYNGVSDETWLWSRITLPVPSADIRNQTQDRYTYRGFASAALTTLVNINAGPGARIDRIVPRLDVATSPSLGKQVEISTRFDTLGIKLQEIAASAGLGWRLRQGLSDRLVFEVYLPKSSESKAVRFSPQDGNLAAFDYSLTAPMATRYVVAAQGEGKYRWLTQYDDGQAKTLNDTNPAVEYSGSGWTYEPNRKVGDYFNDIHHTSGVGASVTFTFTGTAVQFITEKGPDAGTATVYLDDVQVATINLNQSNLNRQAIGWQSGALPYGEHKVRIVNGSAKLVVDAWKVTGLPSVAHEWFNTPLEQFIDRRDIPVGLGLDGSPINPDDGSPAAPEALTQLDQAADEATAESAATASLSITPIDTPSLRYGHDYEVGDIVSVLVDGQLITDVLREVHLTDGDDGPTIKPIVGTDGASETPFIYREIRKLWNSLRKLEARR